MYGKYINTIQYIAMGIICMSNCSCRYQSPKTSQRQECDLSWYATSCGLAIEMASVPTIFRCSKVSQPDQQQVARREGQI